MSRGKRTQRVRTEEWGQIQQYSLRPEQVEYELIRQCVLSQESAATRARETGVPERTISRKVKQFEEQGMISLFAQDPVPAPDPLPRRSGTTWESCLKRSRRRACRKAS